MEIDARFYMHDSDRVALDALKAIPGFTSLLKAFLKVFNEKQFYLQNVSSNLRLSERQLPEVYNLLPPICEKLGIPVPELYLELNGTPDAYTFGDTRPFIVISSGLLKKFPADLIPTVLARECGHIACRHCLFTTMGRIVFSETSAVLGVTELAPLKSLVTLPLEMGFAYWSRCSELSADRFAAIYERSSDKIIQLCMAYAGLERGIAGHVDVDAFLEQAEEYRDAVRSKKLDRTMEFLSNYHRPHPLNAVRACECRDWMQSERAEKIVTYVHSQGEEGQSLCAFLQEVPTVESVRYYLGRQTEAVVEELGQLGFENITTERTILRKGNVRPGQVSAIYIDGQEGFQKYQWLPIHAAVRVEYFEPETEEEIAAAHPGQLRAPNGSRYYRSQNQRQAVVDFEMAGFTHVETEVQKRDRKGLFDKEETILQVSVDGQTQFEKGDWFAADAPVRIVYVTYLG